MNKMDFLPLFGAMVFSTNLQAAGAPVPHVFQANTTAKASEVNNNFQNLADRIEATDAKADDNANRITANENDIQNLEGAVNTLSITHDYKNYSVPTDVKTKVFTVTSTRTLDYDTETRDYTFTPSGSDTNVNVVRKRYAGGVSGSQVHWNELDYVRTAESFIFRERRKTPGGTLSQTDTPNPPILVRHNRMRIGSSWGNGVTVDTTRTATPTQGTSYLIDRTTLLGVENMDLQSLGGGASVPCLKTYSQRNNDGVPAAIPALGSFRQVQWHCEGFGLVKKMEWESPQSILYELTSITK